jgi:hypothetical protein
MLGLSVRYVAGWVVTAASGSGGTRLNVVDVHQYEIDTDAVQRFFVLL